MAYAAFAEVYDRLTENVEYAKRAEYICSLLGLDGRKTEGLLLDLACGTGSLSLEFCRRGFEVIGVDNSPDMLSLAQKKLADEGLEALFVCQDMRELELHGQLDFALSALDSLNHITEKDDLHKVFERLSLHMKKGGIFVFDVNTQYKHEKVLADNAFVFEDDEIFCVWQNFYAGQGRVDIYLDIFLEEENGAYSRYSEEFSEQAYSDEILKECLYRAGFELISVFDELTFEPPHETSERLFYIARKKD